MTRIVLSSLLSLVDEGGVVGDAPVSDGKVGNREGCFLLPLARVVRISPGVVFLLRCLLHPGAWGLLWTNDDNDMGMSEDRLLLILHLLFWMCDDMELSADFLMLLIIGGNLEVSDARRDCNGP